VTDRDFAEWVRPVAEVLASDRREVIEFARSVPEDWWDQPSAVEGWTRKDLLAHLAGGNDQLVQIILRAVTSGEAPDPELLQPDTDAENSARVAERSGWSIDRLIATLESDGAEMQDLLSKLTDGDERRQIQGIGLLGRFMRIVQYERHDAEHLAQLRGSTP